MIFCRMVKVVLHPKLSTSRGTWIIAQVTKNIQKNSQGYLIFWFVFVVILVVVFRVVFVVALVVVLSESSSKLSSSSSPSSSLSSCEKMSPFLIVQNLGDDVTRGGNNPRDRQTDKRTLQLPDSTSREAVFWITPVASSPGRWARG